MPAVGIVAVGTLPRPVAARRRVTRLAVVTSGMAKDDLGPAVGVVAGGTLARHMPGRRLGGVAAPAVGQAIVAKVRRKPLVCVMAVGAGGGEVVAWCAVTIGAIGKASVGDPHLIPGGSEMAAAAVTRVVVVWHRLLVAAAAVCLPGMIECHLLPGGFLVAAAALPRIMVVRQVLGVALLAVLVEGMIKGDL